MVPLYVGCLSVECSAKWSVDGGLAKDLRICMPSTGEWLCSVQFSRTLSAYDGKTSFQVGLRSVKFPRLPTLRGTWNSTLLEWQLFVRYHAPHIDIIMYPS